MKHPLTSVITAAAVFALAVPVQAQTVAGVLVDEDSGDPIILGTVSLADSNMVVVDQTVTDESGSFLLESDEPGAFYVAATAPGYAPRMDGVLDLGEGGQVEIRFSLKVQPFEMAAMNVSVSREQIDRHLEMNGFYQRRDQGSGSFLGPDEMEQREGSQLSAILESVSGLTTRVGGSANAQVRGRLFARDYSPARPGLRRENDPGQQIEGYCTPRLFVDGVEQGTASGGGLAGLAIDDEISAENVAAVEVYARVSNVPAQYGGANASCGVILVWSKTGAAQGGG